MSAIPQHSSKSNEHYTPAHVVEAARDTLGGFDLDPASCVEANATVRAARIIALPFDGLAVPWHGRVFLNPPGGLIDRRSSACVWWNKLVAEYAAERVSAAIFVGFTLEILRSSQSCVLPVQAFARCYPSSRLQFSDKGSPPHANVIVYLGDDYARFLAAFTPIGFCEPGAP